MKTLSHSAKKLKTIKTSTFLPAFNGFYGTFLGDLLEVEESEYEYLSEEHKRPITYDDLIIDYKKASQELSKDIFNVISQELESEGYVNNSEFDNLCSPREYNFYNDSINCTFTFNPINIKKIQKYIKDNFTAWTEYLTRYKSRDGFSSFYSDDAADWNISECLKHEHKAGSILEFILKNEDFDDSTIYDRVCGNFSLSNYTTVKDC